MQTERFKPGLSYRDETSSDSHCRGQSDTGHHVFLMDDCKVNHGNMSWIFDVSDKMSSCSGRAPVSPQKTGHPQSYFIFSPVPVIKKKKTQTNVFFCIFIFLTLLCSVWLGFSLEFVSHLQLTVIVCLHLAWSWRLWNIKPSNLAAELEQSSTTGAADQKISLVGFE